MHAQQVCHKIMNNACAWMHGSRRSSLNASILAAIRGQRLTVTGLGRAMRSEAKEKHCIKRADRLLSNVHLYQEHRTVYQTITQLIIGSTNRPVILVDWSDLNGCRQNYLLRAGVSIEGRSLTLYEEVHTLKAKEKPKVHDRFLRRLKAMLPAACRPIIVTDAGFRSPWFKNVETLGWDWVGRVRNRTMMRQEGFHDWAPCKDVYSMATSRAKYLGPVELTRANPISCKMVLYKSKPKGRVRKNGAGERARLNHSSKNAVREKEPWLLATSLPATLKLAKQVVNIYASRMQIEEAFRDTKSCNYGLGYELSGTKNPKRLQILLLIAALAALVLWILGTISKMTNQHRQYQANTVTERNVLSAIFLGLRVASDRRFNMSEDNILHAAQYMWDTIESHASDW